MSPLPNSTSRHLSGTTTAATVQTDLFKLAKGLVLDSSRNNGVGIVQGQPGLGKTFATSDALETLALPYYWIDVPSAPRGREFIFMVYDAMTGGVPENRATHFSVRRDLLSIIRSHEKFVLVVDECQNMTQNAFQDLRYLWDQGKTFALILVGVNVKKRLVETRVPELLSRARRCVDFTTLEPTRMRAALNAYHPMFQNTAAEVLVKLYDSVGGYFRDWAIILEIALVTLNINPEVGISMPEAKAILKIWAGTPRQTR
jgi:DNA transposition AAA+ family ATPase